MAIALACPTCAQSVPVTADMAGRRARCPQCRRDLQLPTSLIELPDRGELDDPSPRRRGPGSWWPWVLLGGAALAALLLLCGTPVTLVLYLLRQERAAAELAHQATVMPAGANLPPGAPPRALRVNGFQGVWQTHNQLGAGDPLFNGPQQPSRFCKEYVIDLEAGKTYIINLDAPNFDAYLRVADLRGQVFAEDDDSGGGLNSQIQFIAPEAKSYLVVATSLSGGVGPFTLVIREAQFPRPR